MKRYLVFAFNTYYPLGGVEDFAGDTDTFDEALWLAAEQRRDEWNILDTETGKVWNSNA